MSWRYKGGFIQEFFDPLTAAPQYFNFYVSGLNADGRLGLGDRNNYSSPVLVGGSSNTWSTIAAGINFSSAIKQNKTLWSWGDNLNGQLGQNDVVYRSSPTQIGALTNWSILCVKFGRVNSAIKTDGTLWNWGNNTNGFLGLGDTINRSSPTQVGTDTNWSAASFGVNSACALRTNGTLWVWGNNGYGQFGTNNVNTIASSPIQVGSSTDWSKISTGNYFVTAIKTNNTIWTWGRNESGQLGQNNVVNRSSPVQVGALTTWSKVSNGNANVIAIKTDGTLWAWGENTSGQLGQNDKVYRSSPVQIGALTTWSNVSSSNGNSVGAIKTDGTAWSWGYNANGGLGLNDTESRSSPTQIGSNTNWAAVSAGGQTILLLTTEQ